MIKIVKMTRKQFDEENPNSWYLEATYSNGENHSYQTMLTSTGSKGWLTRAAGRFGLLKISEDVAILKDTPV